MMMRGVMIQKNDLLVLPNSVVLTGLGIGRKRVKEMSKYMMFSTYRRYAGGYFECYKKDEYLGNVYASTEKAARYKAFKLFGVWCNVYWQDGE